MEHSIMSVLQKFVTDIWHMYCKIYWLILSVVVDALNIIKDTGLASKQLWVVFPFFLEAYLFMKILSVYTVAVRIMRRLGKNSFSFDINKKSWRVSIC
jgi:hypothetical protein